MRLINLTPHAIVIRPAQGADITLPPSGQVARVTSTPGIARDIHGVPCPVTRIS